MKTFQLEGTPRTDLGKKAVKALRKNGLIPAVLNGGEVFNLPYTGKLNEGEKSRRNRQQPSPYRNRLHRYHQRRS